MDKNNAWRFEKVQEILEKSCLSTDKVNTVLMLLNDSYWQGKQDSALTIQQMRDAVRDVDEFDWSRV